jgi:hypothetical protein
MTDIDIKALQDANWTPADLVQLGQGMQRRDAHRASAPLRIGRGMSMALSVER